MNFDFNLDRDFAIDDTTINETLYTINSGVSSTVVAFYVEKDADWFINDSVFGDANAPQLPASGVFNQLKGFLYPSSTGGNIPQSNAVGTLQDRARVIMVSRPTLQDRIKPGSISADFIGEDTGVSAYNDLLATGVTGAISPQGELRGALTGSSSSNHIGTVFYDYGLILLHGTDSIMDFSAKAIGTMSGLSFNSASASNTLSVDLDLTTEKIVRKGQYFAHLYNKEGNFSTNPTYSNASGALESNLTANPTTFITSVGLFNENGEMLAVAKVSPPVKKDFNSEAVFKINLEY